jgi:hypothetical protein
MSFSLFAYTPGVEGAVAGGEGSFEKMERLAKLLGSDAFPDYLAKYIRASSSGKPQTLAIHAPISISGYSDGPDINKKLIVRRRGFIGKSQLEKFPVASHHIFILYNSTGEARLIYKFVGSIQFIKNTATHDTGI